MSNEKAFPNLVRGLTDLINPPSSRYVAFFGPFNARNYNPSINAVLTHSRRVQSALLNPRIHFSRVDFWRQSTASGPFFGPCEIKTHAFRKRKTLFLHNLTRDVNGSPENLFSHAAEVFSDCLLIEPQVLRRNVKVMVVMAVVRGREQIGRARLARQQLAHELDVGDGEAQRLDSRKSLFVGKRRHFPTQLVERWKNVKLNESGILNARPPYPRSDWTFAFAREYLRLSFAPLMQRGGGFSLSPHLSTGSTTNWMESVRFWATRVVATRNCRPGCEAKLLNWRIFFVNEFATRFCEKKSFFSPRSWNPIISL